MSRLNDPVLILDCEGRSALACIRSLGRASVPMVLASHDPGAPGFHSRHARGQPRWPYQDPLVDSGRYVEDIVQCVEKHDIPLILPQSERTLLPLLAVRDELAPRCRIPAAENELLLRFQNKFTSASLLSEYGISLPAFCTVEDVTGPGRGFDYPCLVKPRRSVWQEDGRMSKASVKWISSDEQLTKWLERDLDENDFFFQQYIPGHGGAIYYLFWNGEYQCHLEQATLRQQIGPGAVTRAVSSPGLFPELEKKLRAMLADLRWSGVIMMEVRRNAAGEALVIDCNPRFWGPTQLAVDSGVDFPLLLYKLAMGMDPAGDMRPVRPSGYSWRIGEWYSEIFRRSGRYNDLVDPGQHNDNAALAVDVTFRDLHFRLDDIRPAYYEFKRSFLAKLWQRLRTAAKARVSRPLNGHEPPA